ncbi:M16 family metallopeptidase [Cryptosporangium aurantiacum]|uniref:Predicted Zn-dependent peptidase n=1 Tax=Cryptosporangium aurantiacum TaxID=134849 RepID=A0A1M7IQL3_9ACTN|nr:pitrilysin family protein [Cryptosporangium aurantiacum]SHM42878.1 Predicted Zn-dependent peptidase [Cryptosporangium aurantiacum]
MTYRGQFARPEGIAARAVVPSGVADARFGGTVRRTVLPNGLRIVTEALPTVRSVSFGIWVGIGSRDETPRLAGASHFLEHLLFKGTRRRNAWDISAQIEAVGGDTNAFTAKEYTCYYARVLDSDLPLAVDVVCDMLTSSLVTASDLEVERQVILEEIAMHDDEPSDVVHDLFTTALYGDHPLGRPVIGTTESITAMNRAQVAGFYRRRYTPPQLVVSAAGNLDHDETVRLVAAAFDAATRDLPGGEPVAPRRGAAVSAARPTLAVRAKETEQAHLVLGVPALDRHDERRFALGVLDQALGGGMSSRLFQEIREQRGLAYSVYSYDTQYADAGLFGVYAGCAPRRAHDVLDLMRSELDRVATSGLTDEEVRRGKGMLRGATVLGLEDTGSRMSRIGKAELLYGNILSIDEVLARIDAVTPDDVRAIADDLFTGPVSLGVVGPFAETDFDGFDLGGDRGSVAEAARRTTPSEGRA